MNMGNLPLIVPVPTASFPFQVDHFRSTRELGVEEQSRVNLVGLYSLARSHPLTYTSVSADGELDGLGAAKLETLEFGAATGALS
jgi:hypothetical protein